jgi:hypothetical protein
MFQYTAIRQPGELRGSAGTPEACPEQVFRAVPARSVSESEYHTVMAWLDKYGIEDGYCQELVSIGSDWLPDFEKDNPFPSALSIPVWHWRTRFL